MEMGKAPSNNTSPKNEVPAEAPTDNTLQPVPSKGSKAWIWILVVVVILLIGGGIFGAMFLARDKNKSANTTNNTSTSNSVTNNTTRNNTTRNTNNAANTPDGSTTIGNEEQTYLNDADKVIVFITNAFGNYEDAANLGSTKDFEGSTEKLKDGLEQVAKAEAGLANLDAPSSLEQIHDLLSQVVTKTREALELAIEGNEAEDVNKIDQSAVVMQQVADLLERISAEFNALNQ